MAESPSPLPSPQAVLLRALDTWVADMQPSAACAEAARTALEAVFHEARLSSFERLDSLPVLLKRLNRRPEAEIQPPPPLDELLAAPPN